jgi:hypothetical protein
MRFDVRTLMILRIIVVGNVALYSGHCDTACASGAVMRWERLSKPAGGMSEVQ